MDAGAKKLSGAARGSFISECLAKKPAAAEGGTGRPGGQKDDASNAQQKDIQDAQFRKWNNLADRAIKSICVGCEGAAARPARARRRAPVADDAEHGGGTADADE